MMQRTLPAPVFGTLTSQMVEASVNAAARLEAFDPERMPESASYVTRYLLNCTHEAATRAISEGTGVQAMWRFHELILEELEIEPTEGARLPDQLEAGFAVYRNDPDADFVRMIVATDLANLFEELAIAFIQSGHNLEEIKIRPTLLTYEGREAERIEKLQKLHEKHGPPRAPTSLLLTSQTPGDNNEGT